ncbi:NodT family efflux transporter outer membrane factor (OMF) lipoprotein [Pseudacidovorax intermedius]|uniref:NodT family efflux transporter outer membrane factor (OMF) lipoprotein n=1 Tax=Pseudacidovorax intermedius TaxID=433924 RepID=A0A370F3T8_9BURK|nr:efflux transporter outer membrane subunit [Pseudacidovorax intermedius]RDI17743.1 NodT family efflux transporter outer membrane factor (OMF) lipoprotein [Pseudacidovorax intermedius]
MRHDIPMTRGAAVRGFAMVGLLAGCAVPRLPAAPASAPPLPAQWSVPLPPSAVADAAEPAGDGWWRRFGSAELDALVLRVQSGSLDLAAAAARLRQAQARAGQAEAGRWPVLEAQAQVRRQGAFGGEAAADPRHALSLGAAWEWDLWGRLGAERDGAQAAVQASVLDAQALRLTLTAAAAEAWLEAVGLAERIRIGEASLAAAERIAALTEVRRRAGTATALEASRQRGLVQAQRAQVQALRQRVAEVRATLTILTAHPDPAWTPRSRLAQLAPPAVATGLPAGLLARRPDIARAAALLAAADAQRLAAEAARWPRLTLTASLGAESASSRTLLRDPAYALAAGLVAPLLDGGRLAAERDEAVAVREERLVAYRQSVVQAFAEVEAALQSQAALHARREAQAAALAEARQAQRLAEARWRAGADDALALLDAQRTLFSAEDEAAVLHQAMLQMQVRLYRVLGGGWSGDALW